MDLELMQACGDVALGGASCRVRVWIPGVAVGLQQSSDLERELGTGALEEESRG